MRSFCSLLFVVFAFATLAEPTVGRLVSGWRYQWVRSESPSQYSKLTFSVPEAEYGDVTYYVEVTNVADITTVRPVLSYGFATDEDVVLGEPAIHTSSLLKEEIRQQLADEWEQNFEWYDWDYEKQEAALLGHIQDVFESVDDYYEYNLPGLSSDEDYWPAIDSAPISNRCWVAFTLRASGKKSPTEMTFAVGVEGSPTGPYCLGVRGSSYDENTSEWERNEWGGQMFGVYSTNYIRRALGVDVLWVTNTYQIPIITRPYIGGQDTGKAYVTFGGSNSLDICFNAPMAGTYFIDGDFPYDYSYQQSNASLNWTTDTPGAVVHNLRPAVSSGATGSGAFTHLYQVQLIVDKAGPCVLKSPVANDVTYAAIPYKAGQARISYPGKLSTDSNGNKYGSALVSIKFVPAATNSIFVATSALQYDADMNLQSCGTVTLPKVWLQGEEVVVEATPYDGYEFDHWEWSSVLEVPPSVDLTSRIVSFAVDADFFDIDNQYRTVALKAAWKRPEHPKLPTSFVNRLRASGKFSSSHTAETIRSVLSCNGRNTVEECYIAGIDPESETDALTAAIEIVDGVPKIAWKPALNGPGEKNGVRKYTVYGSNNLQTWVMLEDGTEAYWSFFKVTVEMP